MVSEAIVSSWGCVCRECWSSPSGLLRFSGILCVEFATEDGV